VLAKHIKPKEEFHIRRIQYHEGTRIKYIPNLDEQTEENKEISISFKHNVLRVTAIDSKQKKVQETFFG
jgi:hypothetical protein